MHVYVYVCVYLCVCLNTRTHAHDIILFAEFALKNGMVLDIRGPKEMDQEMIDYKQTFSDLIEFMNKKE